MGLLPRVTESEDVVDDDVITPYNFSVVETGIYRCGFPPETVKFLQAHNIKLFQFGIQGGTVDPLAPPEDAIAKSIRKKRKKDMITEGLQVLFDERNHPVLIHCRHGNHRTGIVAGFYRKLKQNWCLPCVLEEYERLSGETARQSDMKFIENYEAHDTLDASG
ncbi:tyrosine-protein phosphatase DSP3-like [Papaver somniferum]|uniref:tyrosine-protein phosphatase DSP3-like n=1 Tax=Papaver somniferum TaxID=3469 RepID=UPI000E6F9794|nr:tyrosine-protein phosphatase DSP3-like [Papaver somniferum]